jgi:hypothetical protein
MPYPEPALVEMLRASRDFDLWLVRRLREKSAYVRDPDHDSKRFEAAAARFKPVLAWRSSEGSFEMWHAHVPRSRFVGEHK